MRRLGALLLLGLASSCDDIDAALARRLDAGAQGGGTAAGGGTGTGGGAPTGGGGGTATGGGMATGGGTAAPESGICLNGFCWEHPLPQGNGLSAVWGASVDEVWLFGEVGTALRWTADGGWENHQRAFPQTMTLRSAWGAGGSFWVVGTPENGPQMPPHRFDLDGGGWHTEPWGGGPQPELLSVRGRSADDVWAVGYSAVIAQRVGGSWQARTLTSAGTSNLSAIAFDSEGRCLVSSHNPVEGVLPCDGGARELTLSANDELSVDGLWSTGPGLFRAAGTRTGTTPEGRLWRRDADGGWVNDFAGELSCSAVASSPTLSFVSCGRGVLRGEPPSTMLDNTGLDPNDQLTAGWTPGSLEGSWLAGVDGRAYRYQGQWLPQRQGSFETIFGLWVDDQRVLGVGSSSAALTRNADSTWSSVQLVDGQGETRDLWVSPSGNYRAYAGVNRMLFEGHDAADAVQAPGVPVDTSGGGDSQLNGLWGTSETDLWAVGTHSEVWHRSGTSWSRVLGDGGDTLWDIAGTDDANAFAVGHGCLVLRRDATADGGWTRETPGGCSDELYGVWVPSTNDAGLEAVAVSMDTRVWVRRNGAWTSQPITPAAPGNLYKVWGTSPADIWAVGDFGAVMHFDGGSWGRLETGTRKRLESVRGRRLGTGQLELFVSGESGTVLRKVVP